ncbi:ABC transporter permease [Leucothrix arctica]|uniref:Peptide ABC transporter permease n=1 Tax=Leucothrix arctica TaxID=1481894 RepID=A0A317C4K5_9GAMM|nr:FtsX-like permease family protein [Leucothrix arctica]PWQ93131.1 peptide ABC transporter permease [Leucothrix arctica]
MILFKLTWHSLWNRRVSVILTLLSIAISVSLLLGVEYIRKEAKTSFLNTISGTDLVVGARSGPVQLLLYSVFRIGNATNNITWDSYQTLAEHKRVAWTIPFSLGDSHKGYRVLGTNQDYFKYYQYSNKQPLALSAGKQFDGVYDAVIGAEVAKQLNYKVGTTITLAHGAAATSFSEHKNKPFNIVGILKPTGTPIDRTVHVSLEGIEAIHIDWKAGSPVAGFEISAEKAARMNLTPTNITAFLVGLKSRATTFRVQREINEFEKEPLLAVVPGVALAELWQSIGQFETVLRIITLFVLVAGLLGMLTTLLSTLNERRREMAILRAVGAYPWHVFLLFLLEALIIVVLGCVLGCLLVFFGVQLAQPWVTAEYGLHLSTWILNWDDAVLLLLVTGLAVVFSTLPALIAYRRALQDGLTVKV